MPYPVPARSAFITGASRGIGAATALALSASGVTDFMLHYNSYREGAEQIAQQLQDKGGKVHLLGGDLSTIEGIQDVAQQARALPVKPEILVNNAGSLVSRAALPEATLELYNQIMNLNVASVWFISQAIVPAMLEQGRGWVINLSSIAARTGGGPGATLYASAKAAVSTMTKGMAKELAPRGIRVNAVSPGTVDNYFHEKYSTQQMLEGVTKATPAGRLATNEEIAETIVYLCSDAASYVHGQTIELNGGFYMP